MRGIYTAIRNPRSHDKRVDSAETADILISFIGWIASLIDKSKSRYDTQQIVSNVFDKHFAPNERYADLLVSRIPPRKRLEILVEVFQRREEGRAECVRLFTGAMLKTLTSEEQVQFWEVVSDALENAVSDSEFRSAIQIIGKNWANVSELARIRAEHRLIESLKEGLYDSAQQKCLQGSLGTWVTDLENGLVLKENLATAISERLRSEDPQARAYGLEYFVYLLKRLKPTPPQVLVWSLKRRLQEGDRNIYEVLNGIVNDPFDQDDDLWVEAFKKSSSRIRESIRNFRRRHSVLKMHI